MQAQNIARKVIRDQAQGSPFVEAFRQQNAVSLVVSKVGHGSA